MKRTDKAEVARFIAEIGRAKTKAHVSLLADLAHGYTGKDADLANKLADARDAALARAS